MKILFVITRSEAGGAQVYVRDLLLRLHGSVELHLAVGEKGYLVNEAERLGVKTHILPNLVHPLSPIKDIFALKDLFQLIKVVKPDLVHLNSSKAGIVGRFAAFLQKVPFVYTAHGWAFTEGTSFLRKAISVPCEWVMGHLGGKIVTVSEYDYKTALKYKIAPKKNLIVIRNGIYDSKIKREFGEDEQCKKVKIIMVARFAPPKDQISLLYALKKVSYSNWDLEFVGDGPTIDFVKQEAERIGLSEKVHFSGVCNDIDKRLAISDVFLLISNYEGLPLSILEAMRAGIPVIASIVGGVQEAVIDGKTGYLVPRGDAEALISKLEFILKEARKRVFLGNNGRAFYEKEFTHDAMFNKLLSVYEKMTVN